MAKQVKKHETLSPGSKNISYARLLSNFALGTPFPCFLKQSIDHITRFKI